MKFLASRSSGAAKGGPPREFLTAVRRVTAAEMRSLGANPIELVPAPGPGKLIIPLLLIAAGAGGVGFDNTDGNPTICYDGDPALGPVLSVNSLTGYPAPFIAIASMDGNLRDAKANAPLVLTTDTGGEITGGGYDVDLRIEYEIVTL